MVQELFFDRVPAEPGDGAQSAGDGGARSPSCFQVPGKALDISAAHGKRAERMTPAPGGEPAQVQRVGFPGQAAVPGGEAG